MGQCTLVNLIQLKVKGLKKNTKFLLLSFILAFVFVDIGINIYFAWFSSSEDMTDMPKFHGECMNVLEESYLHPWFGPLGVQGKTCDTEFNNRYGLKSKDYPKENSPNKFNILLVGGSVAEMFYMHNFQREQEFKSGLEVELNKRYQGKNGSEISVYSGAKRDFRQPQALHFLLEEIQKYDLIISLEGYNETWAVREKRSIPNPPDEYKVLILRDEIDGLVSNKKFIENTPIKFSGFGKLYFRYLSREIKTRFYKPLLYEKYSVQNEKVAVDKYLNYQKSFSALCREFNKPCVSFFQPHPGIKKTLTKKEKGVVQLENKHLISGELYKKVIDAQMSAPLTGLHKVSLLPLLEKVNEDIYIDHIHLNFRGNDLMTDKIIEELAKLDLINRK